MSYILKKKQHLLIVNVNVKGGEKNMSEEYPTKDEMAAKTVKLVVKLIPFFVALLVLFSSFRAVAPGTVKVVTRFGRVTGRTLEPGANLIVPFVEKTLTYNTKKVIYETTSKDKQKGSEADYKDYPVDTNTQDGQQVDIFYTIRFNIDPAQAIWIAQNIGSEEALVEKIVKTESRIWARNVPRGYSAESLYTGSGSLEVQNEIFNVLNPTFKGNGLILDGVGIREIKFAQDYIDAIEDKQIQFVKVESEKNIAEQAKFQKEARITNAEAQATEQELQKTTITDQLLEKMWIEKWDGNLPTYMMGDSQALIQLP